MQKALIILMTAVIIPMISFTLALAGDAAKLKAEEMTQIERLKEIELLKLEMVQKSKELNEILVARDEILQTINKAMDYAESMIRSGNAQEARSLVAIVESTLMEWTQKVSDKKEPLLETLERLSQLYKAEGRFEESNEALKHALKLHEVK